MKKEILSLSEIGNLIKKNRYTVRDYTQFKSRCIDGRYKGDNLSPLACPGADVGVLMEMLAINDTLSLGLKKSEVADMLVSIVGGYENFNFHTDRYHQTKITGCGHIKEALQDPASYQLTNESASFLRSFLHTASEKGIRVTILEGDHTEEALLIIKGADWSLASDNKIFVYHKTLDDQRRRLIAHKMICSIDPLLQMREEYLYDMLSKIADNQRGETLKRLAAGLTIYQVSFKKNGAYEIKLLPDSLIGNQ